MNVRSFPSVALSAIWIALCLVGFVLASSYSVRAQGHSQDERNLAVMLTAHDAQSRQFSSFCAAGIVVSQDADRTIILTAKHVVKDMRTLDPEGSLRVEFFSRRGETFAANELNGPGMASNSLDYALLAIKQEGTLPSIPVSELEILTAAPTDIRQMPGVRSVGYADCIPWDMDPTNRPVIEANNLRITFESPVVSGASGGPLFTSDGKLVGMVVRSDGRRAVALPISTIQGLLKDNYISYNWNGGENARKSFGTSSPRIAWKARIGIASWRNNPIIAGSRVFVGSSGEVWNKPDFSDAVYAFDLQSGKQLWKRRFFSDVNDIAYEGGIIYGGTDAGQVFALDGDTGENLWSRLVSGAVYASPIYHNGNIIVATGAGNIYLLNAETGIEIKAVIDLDGGVRASILKVGNTIYAGTETGSIYWLTADALNPVLETAKIVTLKYPDKYGREFPSLKNKLTHYYKSLGEGKYSTPSIYGAPIFVDRKLIIGYIRQTYYDYPSVLAIDPTADDVYVWQATTRQGFKCGFGNTRASPAIFEYNVIFGSPYSNCVFALDSRSGKIVWETELGAEMFQHWSSPIVDGQNVYIARHDGFLHKLGAKMGKLIWSMFLGSSQIAGRVIQPGDKIPENRGDGWNPLGTRAIFSTPFIKDGVGAVATDEGYLYLLTNL